jgi:hypothetical protein
VTINLYQRKDDEHWTGRVFSTAPLEISLLKTKLLMQEGFGFDADL